MIRLPLIALVPLFCGCTFLQRVTDSLPSDPEPDRSLWREYNTEYRDLAINCRLPSSRRYPEATAFSPRVPDAPPLASMAVDQVLSAAFDVDTGQGFPEFIVDMVIFALPTGTEGGQKLAALQAHFLARAPQDCHLLCEELTSNGTAWLHVTYTDRTHGYLIKDIYMCPLSPDRYLYLAGTYGAMTLNPEWLASRRKVIEDIFRSVRIERNGP